MNPIFKDLLNKQMSRQEFLKQAGMAAMAVFGAANMLQYMLAEMNRLETRTQMAATSLRQAGHGFGAGKFGV